MAAPTTVSAKFMSGEVREFMTLQPLSSITPESTFDFEICWELTAPMGTKLQFKFYMEGNGKRYYLGTTITSTLVRHYYGEKFCQNSVAIRGGEVQANLGITSDTTVTFGTEMYYEGRLLSTATVSIPFIVSGTPPVEPDVVIEKVKLMDADTLFETTTINPNKKYYFEVNVKLKGEGGDKFTFAFYVINKATGEKVGIASRDYTLQRYCSDWCSERISYPYAVSGRWILQNAGNPSDNFQLCCEALVWKDGTIIKNPYKCTTITVEGAQPPLEPEPQLSIPSITTDKDQYSVGEPVILYVTVANTGNADGKAKLQVKVDGKVYHEEPIEVKANTSQVFEVEIHNLEAGSRLICVELV